MNVPNISAREFALRENARTRQQIAENPNLFSFIYPEDESYWEEQASKYGIVTAADVIRRDLIQSYSDLYKDINGIRPRWVDFLGKSLDEIEERYKNLIAQAEALEDEEDEDFEDEVQWV